MSLGFSLNVAYRAFSGVGVVILVSVNRQSVMDCFDYVFFILSRVVSGVRVHAGAIVWRRIRGPIGIFLGRIF